MAIGEILGFHHVKVPVSDLEVSRAWYERVFDLKPNVEFRDNDDVVRGVAYQPKNGFTLSLRQNSKLAQTMEGFDPLAVLVGDVERLICRARSALTNCASIHNSISGPGPELLLQEMR